MATPLAQLVETSRRVGEQSGRRAKIALIAELLRGVAPNEIGLAVTYLSGAIRQQKIGIGWAAIQAARPRVRNDRKSDDVKSADATPADAGAHGLTRAPTPALTIPDVDATLERIANISGKGSNAERGRLLADLFGQGSDREQDFLSRLLIGELRQGALDGLMIEAVAVAAELPADAVRRAAMVAGGIASVAAIALTEGASGLARFAVALFQPLAPMLAQPADDIADAMARIPLAALEWKLDGARVQVHKQGDTVRIFSRTGNDVTDAAPEIVGAVKRAGAHALILDGEAIALKTNGKPYAFQDTMRRFGRIQHNEASDALRATMPLSVFFFDCMRRDEADLLAAPASERFAALAAVLPYELLIPRLVTGDAAAAQAFYDDAVARGQEGVMVKALDSAYDPGARSAHWLKVKREHSLDLVVLAAEWGHGRRNGWLSNLHLGAIDPATGSYVMLGKTFKGMTDEMLAWQTDVLQKLETTRDPGTVYVRPELVVAITFNDIQASPRYPGGYALRFARVKGYRPDKTAAQADTIETVRAIFAAQDR